MICFIVLAAERVSFPHFLARPRISAHGAKTPALLFGVESSLASRPPSRRWGRRGAEGVRPARRSEVEPPEIVRGQLRAHLRRALVALGDRGVEAHPRTRLVDPRVDPRACQRQRPSLSFRHATVPEATRPRASRAPPSSSVIGPLSSIVESALRSSWLLLRRRRSSGRGACIHRPQRRGPRWSMVVEHRRAHIHLGAEFTYSPEPERLEEAERRIATPRPSSVVLLRRFKESSGCVLQLPRGFLSGSGFGAVTLLPIGITLRSRPGPFERRPGFFFQPTSVPLPVVSVPRTPRRGPARRALSAATTSGRTRALPSRLGSPHELRQRGHGRRRPASSRGSSSGSLTCSR